MINDLCKKKIINTHEQFSILQGLFIEPRWLLHPTITHHVSPENSLALHVLEAELADVKSAQACVFLRIRRVVPGVQLIAAKQNCLNHVAALGYLTLNAQLLLQEGHISHVSTPIIPLKIRASWNLTMCWRMLLGHAARFQTAAYQIFRCASLCFPEELQVIITGDVVQQRLSCVAIRLPMLLQCKLKRKNAIRHRVTKCGDRPVVCIWQHLDDCMSASQGDVPCASLSAPSAGQSCAPSSSLQPAPCICSVSTSVSANWIRHT